MGSLTGIIQKLYTQDQFLLFTSKSGRVTGGTQESLRMIGDSVDIEDGNLAFKTFVDDTTLKRLLEAVEASANKSGGRLMKPQQVRGY